MSGVSNGGDVPNTPIKPSAWEWLWWRLREDARVFGWGR